MARFVQRDCTEDAIALFSGFVSRYGLTYEVDTEAPVEVMWRIPAQTGLSLPLILGLQNSDELNLGIEEFWSYFFPFDDVTQQFEMILDKWVVGDARIGIAGRRGRILQLRDGDEWETAYKANTMPLLRAKPRAFIYNDPSYSNSTMT